jgi:hypothetical protein
MKSQWESVLQNLGQWQGSFTLLSPEGEVQEDIPSLISLQGVDGNRSIHLELNRYYPIANSSEREHRQLVMDFSAPGQGAVFFASGAFSEGSPYVMPNARFGTEHCFVDGDRRLRLVQMFEQKQFVRLTLIREQRVGTDAPENAPVTIADLWGEWRGEAVTFYPGGLSPEPPDGEPHSWKIIRQSETQVSLDGDIASIQGSILRHERQGQVYQTLLLPDGGFSTSPTTIETGQAFSLESGWLRSPTTLQRLIRYYNDKGEWEGSTWMTLNR